MTNHQKDILVFILFHTILLVTGLLIGLIIVEGEVLMLMQIIKFPAAIVVIIFAFIGAGGCRFELTILKYLKNTELPPTNRRAILSSLSVVFLICFVIGFADSFSQQTIFKFAIFMILEGVGFGEVFVMMFLCTIWGRK